MIWYTKQQTVSLFDVETLYIIFQVFIFVYFGMFYMFWDIFSRSQVYFIFIMTGEISKCFKIKNLSPTIFQLMTFWPNSIEA